MNIKANNARIIHPFTSSVPRATLFLWFVIGLKLARTNYLYNYTDISFPVAYIYLTDYYCKQRNIDSSVILAHNINGARRWVVICVWRGGIREKKNTACIKGIRKFVLKV